MSETFWIGEAQLDQRQASAVKDLPEDASFLVRGPAGSGKTNIILLRAKWFRLKSISNFKIVVFTSSLKEFAKIGCTQYDIPPESVHTCMSLFKDLLREYGVEFELSGSFETDRALVAAKTQSLLELKCIENVYDALLVDECQDFMDTELLALRRLAKRLILVADSRQSIYRTTHTPGLLEKLVSNKVVTLKYHYRCGLELCTVADAVLNDSVNFVSMRGECKYDEVERPSSVRLVECSDFSSQISHILKQLPGQINLYPNELIGVLFPKREQQTAFSEALERSTEVSDKSKVRVDTMHGAKGLEFRAVHLGGCEALYKMGATQKRLVYTAILRGRTSVQLYFTGSVPGYLESAIAKLNPPKPDPSLDALFGE